MFQVWVTYTTGRELSGSYRNQLYAWWAADAALEEPGVVQVEILDTVECVSEIMHSLNEEQAAA